LIERVRAAGMALPIIIATGVLPEEAFTRSSWLQPVATLMKPYTLAESLDVVNNVLRGTDPIVIWQSCDSIISIVAAGQQFTQNDGEMSPWPPPRT
jgi:hypothetical protein